MVIPSDPLNNPLAILNGQIVFGARGNLYNGHELWKSDGTVDGTILVLDIRQNESSAPRNFVVVGDKVYFSADDGVHGKELWESEANAQTTKMIIDITPGYVGSNLDNFINVNGKLFFTADDGINGMELWVLE